MVKGIKVFVEGGWVLRWCPTAVLFFRSSGQSRCCHKMLFNRSCACLERLDSLFVAVVPSNSGLELCQQKVAGLTDRIKKRRY